ncbi:hypothetical protein LINGRAHAP2_LOCUS24051 [Linum grandiflorum]
MSPQIQRWSGF